MTVGHPHDGATAGGRPAPSDPRAPVLVGTGTSHESAEPVELMTSALQAAARQASPGRWQQLLGAVDQISVPKGTWSYPDPGRLVAEHVGAKSARTLLAQLGIPQQTLVNLAITDIMSGRADVVAVIGAEARAFARTLAPEDDGTPASGETPQPGAVPDQVLTPEDHIMSRAEIAIGLVTPVAQYAMIDNALRHHEGLSLGEHQSHISELWSRFNAVATRNPEAAFPEPRSAKQLSTPGPGNRPLAFPYNRWHASQWTVDQGGASLLCSVEAARRFGVAVDRWLWPVAAIDSNLMVPLSQRRAIHRWPAMGVLGEAASRRLGRPVAELTLMEVYSCFPAAVRVQQAELGLPIEGTPTITGGMAFAGGPLNNFVLQAYAAMAPRLVEAPEEVGMITTVSGLLTKPGLALWTATPDGPPLLADLGAEARQVTETVAVVADHDGPGTVVTYTVMHRDPAPPRLVALLDLPGNRRVLAASEDADLVGAAIGRELIGEALKVKGSSLSS